MFGTRSTATSTVRHRTVCIIKSINLVVPRFRLHRRWCPHVPQRAIIYSITWRTLWAFWPIWNTTKGSRESSIQRYPRRRPADNVTGNVSGNVKGSRSAAKLLGVHRTASWWLNCTITKRHACAITIYWRTTRTKLGHVHHWRVTSALPKTW